MHHRYQYPEIRDHSVSVNESRMPNQMKDTQRTATKALGNRNTVAQTKTQQRSGGHVGMLGVAPEHKNEGTGMRKWHRRDFLNRICHL